MNVGRYDARQTPFLKAHATAIAGFHNNPLGDNQFYNNIFTKQHQLNKYDSAPLPSKMAGNAFINGAKPTAIEKEPVVDPEFRPQIKLADNQDGFYLTMAFDKAWINTRRRKLITTKLMGKTDVSHLAYEQSDGKPVGISIDYFGKPRNRKNPAPGPFENFKTGLNTFKVF